MYSIFLKLFVIALSLKGGGAYNSAPDEMQDYGREWNEQKYMYEVFNELSRRFAIDVTIRLRHATNVQKPYMKMASYHLGSIMASIQDTFTKMVSLYRKYSNMTRYRDNDIDVEDYFTAYYIMQGYYNEIRMEIKMFQKVLDQFREEKEKAKQKNSIGHRIKNLVKGKITVKPANQDTYPKKPRRRFGIGFDALKAYKEALQGSTRKRFGMTCNNKEEQYKRALRMRAWEKKWGNFIPEVEGVDIEIPDIAPDGRPRDTARLLK